jgi:hypothetical protein
VPEPGPRELRDDLLLGGELEVDGPDADPGLAGDVGDGGLLGAVVAEETPGGICASYYVRPGDTRRLPSPPADGDAYHFEIGGGHFADKAGFEGGQGTDGLVMSGGPFAVPPVVHGFEQ